MSTRILNVLLHRLPTLVRRSCAQTLTHCILILVVVRIRLLTGKRVCLRLQTQAKRGQVVAVGRAICAPPESSRIHIHPMRVPNARLVNTRHKRVGPNVVTAPPAHMQACRACLPVPPASQESICSKKDRPVTFVSPVPRARTPHRLPVRVSSANPANMDRMKGSLLSASTVTRANTRLSEALLHQVRAWVVRITLYLLRAATRSPTASATQVSLVRKLEHVQCVNMGRTQMGLADPPVRHAQLERLAHSTVLLYVPLVLRDSIMKTRDRQYARTVLLGPTQVLAQPPARNAQLERLAHPTVLLYVPLVMRDTIIRPPNRQYACLATKGQFPQLGKVHVFLVQVANLRQSLRQQRVRTALKERMARESSCRHAAAAFRASSQSRLLPRTRQPA